MNEVGRGDDHDHKNDHRLVNAVSSIYSMDEVVVSPYEGIFSAEVGEPIFDQVKSYLDPNQQYDNILRRQDQSREAEQIWGRPLARTLVDTSAQIASSGILYGFGWKEGRIQNKHVGKLPSHLLLLCLPEHRICRSHVATSSYLIKDLDLLIELDRIIRNDQNWNWRDKYPKLHQTLGVGGGKGNGINKSTIKCNLSLFVEKRRLQCHKCILFVVRAVTCMRVLQKTAMNDSLRTKLEACLSILETNCTPKTSAVGLKVRGCKPILLANELPRQSLSVGRQTVPGPSTNGPSCVMRSTVIAPVQRQPHISKAVLRSVDSSSSDSGDEEYSTGFIEPSKNYLLGLSHRLLGSFSSTSRTGESHEERKDSTISNTAIVGRPLSSSTQRWSALTCAVDCANESQPKYPFGFSSAISNKRSRVSNHSSTQTEFIGELTALLLL
jgi:hypothetical protein